MFYLFQSRNLWLKNSNITLSKWNLTKEMPVLKISYIHLNRSIWNTVDLNVQIIMSSLGRMKLYVKGDEVDINLYNSSINHLRNFGSARIKVEQCIFDRLNLQEPNETIFNFSNSTIFISRSIFRDTELLFNRTSILFGDQSTITLTSSQFISNLGSVVFVSNGDLYINHCLFTDNLGQTGPAVRVQSHSVKDTHFVQLQNSIFKNHRGFNGGVLHTISGGMHIDITNCTFFNNSVGVYQGFGGVIMSTSERFVT